MFLFTRKDLTLARTTVFPLKIERLHECSPKCFDVDPNSAESNRCGRPDPHAQAWAYIPGRNAHADPCEGVRKLTCLNKYAAQ